MPKSPPGFSGASAPPPAAGYDLRAALEAIGDSIWDWDLLSNEVFFSSSYKRMLGHTDEDVYPHVDEWVKRLHPEDLQPTMQTLQAYLAGDLSHYISEHRMLCKDGSWKWLRARGTLVSRTAEGIPARMMGLVTDISQQRQLTEELGKSHALMSAFSQQLPGFFYQFRLFPDGTSCFPYASMAIFDIYGLTPEQVSKDASAVFQRIHPEDLDNVRAGIMESADTLTPWHDEYRVRLSSGERWLVGDARPEKLADGSILWHGFISDISKRKLAEQKLRAAEQQMRLVLKASNQGLYDFNILTGEAIGSPEYAHMLGYAPEDFADSKKFWRDFWEERIHPDDAPRLKKAYQAHFSKGQGSDFHAEFRQKTKSGDWKWIMSLGSVVEWTPQGRAVRMLGTHIDITERKKAEEEARANQELLNASNSRYKQLAQELDILISNAPVGIMFAVEGVIVRANKTLAELCGFASPQAMIGVQSNFLCLNEDDYRAFSAIVSPLLQADEPVDIEWKVRRITGEIFTARLAGRALPTENYVRGAVWMMEDITQQRSMLDALTHSERRLQRLMNSSLIGIAQGAASGHLTDVNEVFIQLSGYTRDELVGRSVFWEMLFSEQDRQACQQAYEQLKESGTVAPFELMLKHKNGNSIPILVGLNHVESSQNEWVVFAMDISERHRISQLKSEFISVVSHELRTPLTSIRGSLSLVEAGVAGELPPKARHLIHIAHNNSVRLIGLVNDILDMDKLVSGKMAFKSEQLDLVQLLENAIDANMAYAASLKVALQLTLKLESRPVQQGAPARSAMICADSARLMQVMANLLSNAAKFSADGDTVDVFLRRHGPTYRVEVADHGPGIPAAYQPHLFEPFTQADGTDTRQQGGTGLGLSITKTLVEKMGGALGFTTCEGRGTTFWFELDAEE
ncbi:PAS domain-containing sensor histidine kinase [Undibacterium sp. TJN25]|uniref:PAS domain-containing sensor histidine kinase n=1 Tax=Undibacterium sp. TJN25 TaxID=3413056 RepID=UPI003BF3709C